MSRKSSSFVLSSLESRSMFSAGFDVAPIHDGGEAAAPIVMAAAPVKTPITGTWFGNFASDARRAGRMELSIQSQSGDGQVTGTITLRLSGDRSAVSSGFSGSFNVDKQTIALAWAEQRSFVGSINASVNLDKGVIHATVNSTVGGQSVVGRVTFSGERGPTRAINTAETSSHVDLDNLLA